MADRMKIISESVKHTSLRPCVNTVEDLPKVHFHTEFLSYTNVPQISTTACSRDPRPHASCCPPIGRAKLTQKLLSMAVPATTYSKRQDVLRVLSLALLYNIYTYDFPHHPSVSICLFADDAAVRFSEP
ncbi:hypothetical protein TNCV_5067161 [Trichonephila clavipes]|nr:hypothetical protein TNCV_5067161 [Trichonephila clavipes]